ncbi:cytochrome b-c1 complex subunit 6, mitochondrial-like [Symsagittifera roscoffensis]|uniref:cytochrome b-c1 complex subunit 6, mitochondrial-like n=1 Tax=Symsagittifera roscoffensis TaxID=84072 RepID=UPI00307B2E0D
MAEQSSHIKISFSAKESTEKEEEDEQQIMNKQGGDEGAVVKVDEDNGGAADGDDDDEDEEDLVDPLDTLRDSCKDMKTCHGLNEKLEACTQRVEGRSKNTEECIEEMLDLVHCVDKCVSEEIHHHWK